MLICGNSIYTNLISTDTS